MAGALSALQSRILRVGFLAYEYLPVPGHWKDQCMSLAFRVAGPVFRGMRYYELWLQRGSAPGPVLDPPPATGHLRILVIDRYVPQPDRDAGSRSTWCVLRALRQMGFAVTFWPRDLLFDREYVPMMEAEGIHVLWGSSLRGRFARWWAQHGAGFSHVMLHRPMIAREYLPAVRRHSRACVLYYGHDLHHARLAREHALTGRRSLKWESDHMRGIEQALWRACDVVYYPSSEETDAVREAVPGVRAWTLPLYFFDQPAIPPGHPGSREGIIFVAGFGHGPNADAAKWLVHEIMPHVWRAVPGVRLWLVGSRPSAEVQALAGPHVTVTGYVSDEQLLQFYARARVAIVPLRVGAGMKGKVVEALYHGLPLVTTPVGAQGLDGLPSGIPVSPDARVLAAHVIELLQDAQSWSEISKAEWEYAAERFSLGAMTRVLRTGADSCRPA